MSVYSPDKLIAQARRLAADYRRGMGKPLPGVSAEIAEYDASRLLNLELMDDRSIGYDAVGRDQWDGQRLLVKGRTIFDESKSGQRIGQLRMDKDWEAVLLVLMDEEYEPYEIYRLERREAEEYHRQASASRRKRGALSVARFKIIGQLVWTRENGLEPEDGVWDNAAGS
ncbi:MAG: hypothetical protein KDH88_02805 [Chromatiales bacterium]|nr:hypothetical protein [Chromatiales bacterium]